MTITLRIQGPSLPATGDHVLCHHIAPTASAAGDDAAAVAAASGRTRIVLEVEPSGTAELVGPFFRCAAAHPDTGDRCVGVVGHAGLHDCGGSSPVADACFWGRAQ